MKDLDFLDCFERKKNAVLLTKKYGVSIVSPSCTFDALYSYDAGPRSAIGRAPDS